MRNINLFIQNDFWISKKWILDQFYFLELLQWARIYEIIMVCRLRLGHCESQSRFWCKNGLFVYFSAKWSSCSNTMGWNRWEIRRWRKICSDWKQPKNKFLWFDVISGHVICLGLASKNSINVQRCEYAQS